MIDEPFLYQKFADLAFVVSPKKDPHYSSKFIEFANQYGHLTAGLTVTDKQGEEVDNKFAEQLRWPNGKPEPVWWLNKIETPLRPPREELHVWAEEVTKVALVIQEWEKSKPNISPIDRSKIMGFVLAQLRYRVVPCYEDSKILSFAPLDLVSAIWLQLAQIVGTDKKHLRCLHCNEWFETSAKALKNRRSTRGDKKYCSDACRMQAYYHRTRKGAIPAPVDSDRKMKGQEGRKGGATPKRGGKT